MDILTENIRALIIDDDPISRGTLRKLLGDNFEDVEIIGEAESSGDAIIMIEELRPHMLFVDVQMPGGSGIDLVEEIPEKENYEIVFISGFYTGDKPLFNYWITDFLVKPVDLDQLKYTVAKAKYNLQRKGKLTVRA